jgi:hypothetical protein
VRWSSTRGVAGGPGSPAYELGQFLASVGVVVTAVLWQLLKRFSRSEVLGTSGTLVTVIAVAAACDIARNDTGLIAAVLMGIAHAGLPRFDIPARRPFYETVIQLMIGLLFISISSTVTPESVGEVLLPTLGLVAVLAPTRWRPPDTLTVPPHNPPIGQTGPTPLRHR